MKYNPFHIIQGWINEAIKTNKWNKVSAYRMNICKQCPEIDLVGDKCKIKTLEPPCCKICGCALSYKTRSNSNCPLGKW